MKDHTLVVLHKTDASFGLYDVFSGEHLETIQTEPFPHEICVSPDRSKIYIAEMGVRGVESEGPGGHTIGVFHAESRDRISTIDTGTYDRPHGLAAHANGHLFVTSESTKHLLIYDLETEQLKHAVNLDQECAHMVNVSPDGKHAFTANIFSNSITKVDVERGEVVKHIPVLERPEGMAFSPDGAVVYVVNRESRTVSVVDNIRESQVDTIETGDGPVRVVITPDGKQLAIPLFHSAAMQIVNTDLGQVTHTIKVGPHPAGTAISPDGELVFISCEDESKVYVFSMSTKDIVRTINTGPGCDAMVCFERHELE